MNKLIERLNIAQNLKSTRLYKQLGELLNVLGQKELTNETVELINQEIENLNSISDTGKDFPKMVKDTESKIIKLVERKLKIVPKNYFRKRWLGLGIVFGASMSTATAIGHIGFLGMGIPVGMVFGIIVGSSMDKKALNEGRQLDFEIKY